MKFFKCKHNDAVYPERATVNSAGYDVTAVDSGEEKLGCLIYDTGIHINELPPRHYVELVPRSSIFKTHLRLANSVGVIDPDYKDSIKVIFDVDSSVSWGDLNKYQKGDRIAQLLIKPYATEADEVDVKKVRTGGLGSTGKKTFKKPKKGKNI